MLTLFPDLLSFSFFGIALLRIAAAIVFAYDGYRIATERGAISRIKLWLFGNIPQWLVLVASFVAFAVAILLAIGLYTQVAAIVGILISLKYMIFWKQYRDLLPLSFGTSALLFVICLFLLISGAGPFAFDLPL